MSVTNIVIGIVLMVLVKVYFLRNIHFPKKLRPCKHVIDPTSGVTCGRSTTRRYQMIDVSSSNMSGSCWDRFKSRFGRTYHWYIFDICGDEETGHVVLVDDGVKWFSLLKLASRHLLDPGQFTHDETLFERSRLIDVAMTSLIERMRHFEYQQRRQSRRIQHTPTVSVTVPPPVKTAISPALLFRPVRPIPPRPHIQVKS